MNSNGYSATVVNSSRELTAREKLMMRDTSNAVRLDEALNEGKIVITPDAFAVIAIHNEHSEDKDYEQYIVVDKEGTKFVTGSTSFWEAFTDIWNTMSGETEPYQIEVYKMESKNYKGKSFITCSII